MADIYTIAAEILTDGTVEAIARNQRVQFGAGTRRYLGAELLPERLVTENQFTEENVTYRTVIANNGTRYSEPQLKDSGEIVGTFDVKLGEIDLARQLTGRDFDGIRKISINNPDAAKARLIAWINTAVNLGLVEKHEKERWDAIVEAIAYIQGTDGKVTPVRLPNPPGHRVTIPSGTTAAPAGWHNTGSNPKDPLEDIIAMRNFLATKGLVVRRLIGDSDITSCLANNPIMQGRLGVLTLNLDGTSTTRIGLVSKSAIDNYLRTNFGLPPIEEYDLTYFTQAGMHYFKRRGALVFVCASDRTEEIDVGDGRIEVVDGTLGYYAIGLAVGEDNPGRIIRGEVKNLKPVGLYVQGFATATAVCQDPELISVLQISKPVQV